MKRCIIQQKYQWKRSVTIRIHKLPLREEMKRGAMSWWAMIPVGGTGWWEFYEWPAISAVHECYLQSWLLVTLLSPCALSTRFWCTAALGSLRRAALIFRACFGSPSLLSLSLYVLPRAHTLRHILYVLSKINGLKSWLFSSELLQSTTFHRKPHIAPLLKHNIHFHLKKKYSIIIMYCISQLKSILFYSTLL